MASSLGSLCHMAACSLFGMTAILIVALIATVGKVKPEIFLHIPSMGFVPFMLFGGNNGMLPPFLTDEPFQAGAYNQWLKDGDVVVASGAKAGTTWLNFCVDAIRRKGRTDMGYSFTDIMYTTPWMECAQFPGETWAQRSEGYNSTILPDGTKLKDYWDHPSFPFRIFKSHYAPIGSGESHAVLPVKERPKVKFISSFRNPVEVAKSIHAFFPKHTSAFQKMWGGFPPHYPNAEAAMKALLPGAELEDLYFGYVRAWWPYINEPNVLVLHYSNMVKDLPALVDKLAHFVNISLTSDERNAVMEKCSFQHMKKHPEYFEYKLPLHPQGLNIMKLGGMINKGKSEKHDAQNDDAISNEGLLLLQDAIDTQLSDPKLKKWALNGGDLEVTH